MSSVPITFELRTRRIIALTIGSSKPAQAAIQSHIVERASVDAVPPEDRFLTVERQVVGELAGDDVGQEPRPRQPLLDRLGEPRGDHDVCGAACARILRPDVLEHDQAGGDVFKLLADLLADRPTLVAAVGAGADFGATSWTIRVRGRLAGNGLRPWPSDFGGDAGGASG